jgi:hypothetical protein
MFLRKITSWDQEGSKSRFGATRNYIGHIHVAIKIN